ncbi:hypothetical protein [Magnetococcus sp. PR-3]|uniref:hypothetical protein n=1 Tax=Magnetococcus sp. PR-3 TaxID=3120355 RepID=UPI002FCE43A6
MIISTISGIFISFSVLALCIWPSGNWELSIFISPFVFFTTLILHGGISVVSLGWRAYANIARYVLFQPFSKTIRDAPPSQSEICYSRKFLYASAVILSLIVLQESLNSVKDPMEYGKAFSWVFSSILHALLIDFLLITPSRIRVEKSLTDHND